MKRIFIFLCIPVASSAQFDLRATLSNTILNIGYGSVSSAPYAYGGDGLGVASLGLEGEWRLKKPTFIISNDSVSKKPKDGFSKMRPFTSTALEFCLLYSNHTHTVHGYTSDYDPMNSQLDIQLVQVPIIFKGNFHMSVLDENLRIGFGLGVVSSYVLRTHLKEDAVVYVRNQGNIVSEQNYADEATATNLGRRFYNSFCIELSFGFKRLFISERAWFSGQDMYLSGLAPLWNVPRSHSVYFNAYDTWPKVTYGGGAFTIGWKIN